MVLDVSCRDLEFLPVSVVTVPLVFHVPSDVSCDLKLLQSPGEARNVKKCSQIKSTTLQNSMMLVDMYALLY